MPLREFIVVGINMSEIYIITIALMRHECSGLDVCCDCLNTMHAHSTELLAWGHKSELVEAYSYQLCLLVVFSDLQV